MVKQMVRFFAVTGSILVSPQLTGSHACIQTGPQITLWACLPILSMYNLTISRILGVTFVAKRLPVQTSLVTVAVTTIKGLILGSFCFIYPAPHKTSEPEARLLHQPARRPVLTRSWLLSSYTRQS